MSTLPIQAPRPFDERPTARPVTRPARAGVVLSSLTLLALLASANARAQQCEDLIKMDGLFTKAKTECSFSYYAWRFQQDSQVCMEKYGKATSKELFIKGQQAFDSKASEMGKEALCKRLLRDFPMTVKR